MKINIKRDRDIVSYELISTEYFTCNNLTLLELLSYIKIEIDSSLAFSSGCRSGVCGSCAVRVNGKEMLACAYKPNDGDIIEPLRYAPLLRDLVVDMDKAYSFNKIAKAWGLHVKHFVAVTPKDAAMNEVQSDCILCGACYSACPVYSVNSEFIGPFALTRAWKYISDVREDDIKQTIEAIQTKGIYDCTLCNECVPVCPQGIAPKQDIVMLRNKSGVMGYMDPNFSSSFGGFDLGLTF